MTGLTGVRTASRPAREIEAADAATQVTRIEAAEIIGVPQAGDRPVVLRDVDRVLSVKDGEKEDRR